MGAVGSFTSTDVTGCAAAGVGWPVRTWVMGHEVFRDGKFNIERCGQEAQFDHARGGYWATP